MNKLIYKLQTFGLPLAVLLACQPASYAQELAMGKRAQRTERSSITESSRQLKDVLNELRNHYQVDILFSDQMVEDHSVPTGVVNMGAKLEKNLESVLKPL